MQADIKGLIAQFEQISSTSDLIRLSNSRWNSRTIIDYGDYILIKTVVEQYRDACAHFVIISSELKSKMTLNYVIDPKVDMVIGDVGDCYSSCGPNPEKHLRFLKVSQSITYLKNN